MRKGCKRQGAGRGDASRYFMLPSDVSNRAYDTEPYHTTISIYWFDVFNTPQRAEDTETLLKGVSLDTAKRKADERARRLEYKAAGAWHAACSFYATREYRTKEGARRLIVVERS